ncbi:MAG: Na+/H+ antiporter NhaC family protein [Gemmatimonadetes bacterium]|nr:Na+/H+ antiporter NhaC family protein [Gemmatimonadota bacterium]
MRRLIVLMVVAAASAGAVGQARSQQIELDGPAVFLRGVGFSITMTAPTATAPVRVTARFADGRLLADTVIAPGSSVVLGDVVVERGSAAPLSFTAGGEVSLMDRPVLPGWVSILPPLVAIGLALMLREVIVSLFAGIWIGCLFLSGYNPLTAVFRAANEFARGELADPDHGAIILFSLLLGGMVGVVIKMGGMRAIVDVMVPLATTRARGQLVTWGAGLAVFFDDYANTLIVGNTMRPLTDRLKVSREKLAYIVDSTAAPVAALFFVSTWIGYQLGLIDDGFELAAAQHAGNPEFAAQLASVSAFDVFLQAIPYMFYPILALFTVAVVAVSGRDFGPMLEAERRAASGGGVLRPGAQPAADIGGDLSELESAPSGRWWNGVIPVAVLIVTVLAGLVVTGYSALPEPERDAPFFTLLRRVFGGSDPFSPLLWGAVLACIVGITLAVSQKILSLRAAIEAWLGGLRAMLMAMIILVLAWSLGAVTGALETAAYISQLLSDTMPVFLLPAAVFVVSALIAFATGTSWATMAILVPLVVPLSITMAGGLDLAAGGPEKAIVLGAIGSVLAGAIMGDHCSPISDTTVLSSTASSCDHVDHVRTQLPYAVFVAGVALVLGVVPSALGVPPMVCLAVGGTVVWAVFRFLGQKVEEAAAGETQIAD